MNREIIEAFTASGTSRICTFKMQAFERPTLASGVVTVKFVGQGKVDFELNRHAFTISPQQYFLVEKGSENTAFIDTHQPTEGLCLFIDSRVSADVLFTLSREEDRILEDPEACWSVSLDVVEGLYPAAADPFGQSLAQLAKKAAYYNGKLNSFTEEAFYALTEQLVRQQQHLLRMILRVPAKRLPVQKEIFRRLETARAYMHDNQTESPGIEMLAMVARMSPFHFMRSFKRVYGVTAYQYWIELRLQLAFSLLLQKKLNVTEIARHAGYADLFAFSKAFKKKFGVPPSTVDRY